MPTENNPVQKLHNPHPSNIILLYCPVLQIENIPDEEVHCIRRRLSITLIFNNHKITRVQSFFFFLLFIYTYIYIYTYIISIYGKLVIIIRIVREYVNDFFFFFNYYRTASRCTDGPYRDRRFRHRDKRVPVTNRSRTRFRLPINY